MNSSGNNYTNRHIVKDNIDTLFTTSISDSHLQVLKFIDD